MNQLLEVAKSYLHLGWNIIPIKYKQKLPDLPEWKSYQTKRVTLNQFEEWFGGNSKRNIAVICGKISGIVALDVDGEKGREFLKGKSIPLTPTCKTARGARYFFKCPTQLILLTKHFSHLELDFLAEGSCAVIPLSDHPSGIKYEWEASPFEIELAEIPDWLLNLVASHEKDSSRSQNSDTVVQSITELLIPFWHKPQRDLLSLYLGGFVAKAGWPYTLAEKLLTSLTNNDEERGSRLQNLNESYARLQEGKELKGYAGLAEILPLEILEQVSELVRSALIPPEMREVDTIRVMGFPPFERKRRIAEYVWNFFKSKGDFIKVPGSEYFYFDREERKLMIIEGMDLQSILTVRFGLNPIEEEFRATIKHLIAYAHREGKSCDVFRLCYFKKDEKVLYIDLGGGQVAKLDGDTIYIGENGVDGVLFLDEIDPVNPELSGGVDVRQTILGDINFSSNSLFKEHQNTLSWAWFRTLFFLEILPVLPLLALIGPKGAGKTAFLKRILIFLYGWVRRHLDSVHSLDDFEVAISSKYFVALDNVDGTIKWLNDALAKASTGIIFTRRKLYTTKDTVSFSPRCYIALNARTPEFRREDVADRLIILKLDRIPEKQFIREIKFIESVVGLNRAKVWGALLNELNSCIHFLKTHGLSEKLDHRLADWSALAMSFAEKDGEGEMLKEALKLMEKERILFSLEDDPLYPLPAVLQDGEWKSARQMWELLGGKDSDFKSSISLGKHLANIKESLKQLYGFRERHRSGLGKEYLFPRDEHKTNGVTEGTEDKTGILKK